MDGAEITYFVWCNICTHRHDIFSCIHTFNHFSTEHYVQYDMCMDTIFLCSKWWYEIYLFAKYLSVLSKRQQELEGAPESTELICCPSFVHLTQQRQPGFKIGTLSVHCTIVHDTHEDTEIYTHAHINNYEYQESYIAHKLKCRVFVVERDAVKEMICCPSYTIAASVGFKTLRTDDDASNKYYQSVPLSAHWALPSRAPGEPVSQCPA